MAIKIGNAPCSWGTLEFDSTQNRRIPYDQMLDELAAAGYEGSELGNYSFMPTTPEKLSEAFASRDLALTGAYTGIELRSPQAVKEGEETAVRTARLLAATADRLDQPHPPFLVLADANGTDPVRTKNAGRVKSEMMLKELEWPRFAGGVEQIARRVKEETGLSTVFHHHCAGYVETPEEIDQLLGHTDPALVGLVFDTGHYSFGAGSSETILASLERWADRIWYVHFKDFAPDVGARAVKNEWNYFESIRQGVFCELGKGGVDFSGVLDWLRQRDYAGFITVEQDVLPGMGAPKESATRNRKYLETIGL